MKRILTLVLIAIMVTGCAQVGKTINMTLTGGVRMEMVMQDCGSVAVFNQYAGCIKSTYNEKGNYPNSGDTRNFYAQMDEIVEMFNRKILSESQARARLYRAWDVTINQSNKLEQARQAASQAASQPRSYGPKTTTCNRVGSSVHCTEF
jgi:hypothetical protein